MKHLEIDFNLQEISNPFRPVVATFVLAQSTINLLALELRNLEKRSVKEATTPYLVSNERSEGGN
jgi:hypothetical protein